MGSKISCSTMTGLVTTILAIAACSSPPTELQWPSAAPPWPPSTVNWGGPATALVCRVADVAEDGTGVYYLEIHSAAFDFSPCESGTARTPIRLGDPQRPLEEGLQERCMYSGATDASVNGFVSVVSSQRPADVRSADRLCTTHHGVIR